MLGLFDFIITVVSELLFLILLFKAFKLSSKNNYLHVLNIAFLLVNVLVLITIIISDLDIAIWTNGWFLGFFTLLSYLILPWVFYWFISNYHFFLKDSKKLKVSIFQTFLLVLTILLGIVPVFFPDLINVTPSNIGNLYNWVYDPKLLLGQFILWMLLLILYVNTQYNLSKIGLTEEHQIKLKSKISLSAIIVFSTPVFFVVDPSFILLSFVIYIVAYYVIYDGMKKFHSVS